MADNEYNSSSVEESIAASRCLSAKALRMQQIAAEAVREAQAENRRLGLPNWYSINGHIVSDIEIAELAAKREAERSKQPEFAIQLVTAD